MKIFAQPLLDDIAARAAASPRQRAHYNIHQSSADLVQRFIVVANRDSYFRPHRHHTKVELAVVLRGFFDLIVFDDAGAVTARHRIGEGTQQFAYETPVGTWHTLVVRSPDAAFLEIKQGPYDPATAAEFAPWAPAEGDPAAAPYLNRLRAES